MEEFVRLDNKRDAAMQKLGEIKDSLLQQLLVLNQGLPDAPKTLEHDNYVFGLCVTSKPRSQQVSKTTAEKALKKSSLSEADCTTVLKLLFGTKNKTASSAGSDEPKLTVKRAKK